MAVVGVGAERLYVEERSVLTGVHVSSRVSFTRRVAEAPLTDERRLTACVQPHRHAYILLPATTITNK